jgi:hypothetical protein
MTEQQMQRFERVLLVVAVVCVVGAAIAYLGLTAGAP